MTRGKDTHRSRLTPEAGAYGYGGGKMPCPARGSHLTLFDPGGCDRQRLATDSNPVAICARDEAELDVADTDIDGDTLKVPTDITDSDAVDQFVSETVDAFGGIDVVVNNAGILGGLESFDALDALPYPWIATVISSMGRS